jgi:hypothetical protein
MKQPKVQQNGRQMGTVPLVTNSSSGLESLNAPRTTKEPRSSYDHNESRLITDAFKLFTKVICGTSEESMEPVAYKRLGIVAELTYKLVNLRAEPSEIVKTISEFPSPGKLHSGFQDYAEMIKRKFGIEIAEEAVERTSYQAARASIEKRIIERQQHTALSQEDLSTVLDAVAFAHDKFSQAKHRPWGPEEKLPMFRHAVEVGLILACAGETADVVTAGVLHDFLELYIPGVSQQEMDQMLYLAFGPRVTEIIRSITEPPKTSESANWLTRKSQVLEELRKHDRSVSSVALAAKISTIGEGNKYLYVTKNPEDISAWSRGSWAENLEMFRRLRDVCQQKGVPDALISRYDVELRRWESFRPRGDEPLRVGQDSSF